MKISSKVYYSLILTLLVVSAFRLSGVYTEALGKLTISDFYTYYYIPKLALSHERVFPYQNFTPLYPYFFPPASLILWYPLIVLPFYAAKIIWSTINLLLIIISAFFIERLFSKYLDSRLVFSITLLLFSFSHPLSFTLRDGQFNIILLFIVTSAYYLSRLNTKEADLVSGFLLAIGTVTKISPALLIIYFLLKKRKTIFISAVLFVISFSALSELTVSRGVNFYYVRQVLKHVSGQAGDQGYTDQSISAFIKKIETLKQPVSKIARSIKVNKERIYSTANYLLVFVLLSVVLIHRRKRGAYSDLVEYSLLVTIGVIGTGLTWYHQYTILLFPAIAALLIAYSHRRYFLVLLVLSSFVLMSFQIPKALYTFFPTLPWYLINPILLYGGLLLIFLLFRMLRFSDTLILSESSKIKGNKEMIIFGVLLTFFIIWRDPIQSHIVGRDKARVQNLIFIYNRLKSLNSSFEEPFLKETASSFERSMLLKKSFVRISGPYLPQAADKMSIVYEDPVNDEYFNFNFMSDGKNFEVSANLESEEYMKIYGPRLVLKR